MRISELDAVERMLWAPVMPNSCMLPGCGERAVGPGCGERAVGVAKGYPLCERHLNESGYGIITVAPYNIPDDRDIRPFLPPPEERLRLPPPRIDLVDLRGPGRTLRLRKASEPLPPWYWYDGRDIGGLSYIPLGVPFLPCESCGKEVSSLYDGKPVCHECWTMHAFAGIKLTSVSLPASWPLPADWHRAALPAQPFRLLQKEAA